MGIMKYVSYLKLLLMDNNNSIRCGAFIRKLEETKYDIIINK